MFTGFEQVRAQHPFSWAGGSVGKKRRLGLRRVLGEAHKLSPLILFWHFFFWVSYIIGFGEKRRQKGESTVFSVRKPSARNRSDMSLPPPKVSKWGGGLREDLIEGAVVGHAGRLSMRGGVLLRRGSQGTSFERFTHIRSPLAASSSVEALIEHRFRDSQERNRAANAKVKTRPRTKGLEQQVHTISKKSSMANQNPLLKTLS